MSAPESILLKVKLLLNLANSPNQNEAENARAMVDKLVAKYNISEEELAGLEDKKPLYGSENKLFETIGIVGWKQQLALGIAKHFFCQIVQEELVPAEGFREYHYFVYGDPEDESNVKVAYSILSKQVEDLIEKKCFGRGNIYRGSYAEGVVESVKNTIAWEGIDIPGVRAPSGATVTESPQLTNAPGNLTKHKEEKEKPVQESVDVNSQSMIKDIAAYFKGLEDGRDLSIQEILELAMENELSKELTCKPEDHSDSGEM